MKITEKQLIFLYQIAMDSVKKNVVGLYSYSIGQRQEVINDIMNQQDGETLINISDECRRTVVKSIENKLALEPQWDDDKKKEEESFLHTSISLLRKWREGASGTAGQFQLTTGTINFLDKYDKYVTIKGEA